MLGDEENEAALFAVSLLLLLLLLLLYCCSSVLSQAAAAAIEFADVGVVVVVRVESEAKRQALTMANGSEWRSALTRRATASARCSRA